MELTRKGFSRVVITGLGAVTSLGPVESLWQNVKNAISGISRIRSFDTSGLPIKVMGEVPGFDPRPYIEHKEVRRMARCSQFAVAATMMALEDAGLDEQTRLAETERMGVSIGTG